MKTSPPSASTIASERPPEAAAALQAPESPLRRGRLLWRVLSLFIPLLAAIFAVSGWLFFRSTEQALDAELSTRLTSIAGMVASTINPRFVSSIRPGDEGSSLYRLLIGELNRIKTAVGAKDIFIFDQRNRVLLDADEEMPIGQEYLLLKLDQRELESVWEGRAAASTLYQGSDGKLYKSGYAPLADAGGAVIAAVGVEAGAEFLDVIATARGQTLAIALLGALLAVAASVLLARSIVTPLHSLISAVESVGRHGAYPTVPIGRSDEIGYLSERFNAMVSSLAEKDRLLRHMYRREKDRADVLQDEVRIKERLAALGELSAGIAHEIRNPLAAITGFTELLERRVEDAASRELAREILQEATHLNRIVTQFLAFAREPQLALAPVDAAAVTRAVIDTALPKGDRPDIRLRTEFPEAPPPVPADADLLRQALVNLIQNAVEAMPAGGELAVRMEAASPWLSIAISDTGEGIDPAYRGRLFHPFFTTKKGGTGLGLAITHRIIQAHGGAIDVESRPGRGSCFTVRLPMTEAAA
ncbi:MAG: ATP-binding protein [Nitrospirota bacterium]